MSKETGQRTVRYVRVGPDGYKPYCEYVTEETDFTVVEQGFASKWGLAGYRILAWRLTDTDEATDATAVGDVSGFEDALDYLGYRLPAGGTV